MKATHMIFLALLVAAVGFAQDVRYNYASGEDFSKYKTYKWIQIKVPTNWISLRTSN
jgi:hypothetical protein